jgi:formyl-CoA transferase
MAAVAEGPLAGIRVVEVANWTFVPAAGAVLADLGADVIKVEAPTGDPQRALQNLLNFGVNGPNPFLEIPNRGKRSVTLDLGTERGHDALLRIVAGCDVFLTSTLAPVRARLRIDVDDIRAANPAIIYVRGTGWGPRGPMADVGGYDVACGWATSGMAHKMARGEPLSQPAAFFDLQGANTIAGAVGMALFKRSHTGEPSVVDVSLMHVAMWALSPDLVGAPYTGDTQPPDRHHPGNPIVNWYKTKDDRWLYLVCLQADRFWSELCGCLGRPELADDPRFVDARVRYQHRTECVAVLDEILGNVTLDDLRDRLSTFSGVWAPVLKPSEVHQHPQSSANGFLPLVNRADGSSFALVAAPMQFDGRFTVPPGPAPELGQHTEDILLEAGLDWDDIAAYREQGAFG